MSQFFRIPGGVSAVGGVAALCLIAGYTSLWMGGTTGAAGLLVLGYLVCLPLALIVFANTGAGRQVPNDPDAPPYAIAALVGFVVFTLYVLTLAPSTAMWDTSEYIAAAKTLGVPHPPGNPVFVMVAHAFAALPIPVGYAARVNLLAATTSAISAALWFLVAHRSLAGWSLSRTPRVVIAVACAWIGATAFTVWNQSVVNEKVYTLAMLGLAASSWAALRWHDAPAQSRRADGFLLLVAYLCGLGYANHPAGFLPVPAFALFVLLRRPATVLRWKLVLAAAAVLFIGLTPFAFVPIRAAHFPGINEGEATACLNGPQVGCTLSRETYTRVSGIIQREQYGGHAVAERQAPLGAQIGMWWLYFKWQWMRDAWTEHPAAQFVLAVLFLGLGLLGGGVHYRRDKASFAYVAPLILTLTPLLIVYLNFKYGHSQALELGDSVPREVRDRDYFYLWSFATWGLWAGLGLGAVWQWMAQRAGQAGARAWQLASPVMLLALIPLVTNLRDASRKGQTFTADWARDLLQSVEPYGILITAGDNDSFPVWYAQQVEGVRRDVTIALIPYLNMPWYAHQLIRERVSTYDGTGIASYAALAGTTPTGPVIALTPAQADSLPPYVQLSQAASFQQGGIHATIPAGYITRDQLMVLQFIRDVFPARPIHFSIGPYAQALGLGDYVVTQGLTQKLLDSKARDNPAYVRFPGGYIDVARTRELWNRYQAPGALLRQGRWLDDASVSIPAAYMQTAQFLAYGVAARGDTVKADSLMRQIQVMAKAARLGQ
ncbi:MAG: DUF2723 domain-containing protein [Gemmatimonadaceae bacterium]|nr:DUF2723 domain-containing protein [Gemmatimonadaceae bacterium]